MLHWNVTPARPATTASTVPNTAVARKLRFYFIVLQSSTSDVPQTDVKCLLIVTSLAPVHVGSGPVQMDYGRAANR
jgi:hypothetical protein